MRIRAIAGAVMVSAIVAPGRAASQPAPQLERVDPRMMSGLFGPKPQAPDDRHSLGLLVSGYGALDQGDPSAQETALFSRGTNYGLTADLSYARRGDLSLALQGGSTAAYHPKTEADALVSYSASAAIGAKLGRGSAYAQAATSYSPYYLLYVFPGASATVGDPRAAAPGTDYATASQSVQRYQASAGLTRPLQRRSTLSVSYDFTRVDLAGSASGHSHYSVGGRLSTLLRRHVTMRAGYAYREFETGLRQTPLKVSSHDVDAGVDYSRALSFSRRTTFTFSTGSAILSHTPQSTAETSREPRRFVHLLGSAQLRHQMRRTWSLTGDFQRNVRFVEGFSDPFLSDAVSASVNGAPARRLRLDATASYARGTVGRDVGENDYHSYTGRLGLRVALARSLAADAQYVYYRYDFGRGVSLPSGVTPRLERHVLRAGLSLWIPFF